MDVSIELIKQLREMTGAGIVDCKEALKEGEGNVEKAIDVLRRKGIAKASKKSGRVTTEGLISSYIHPGGKLGVLVEVNCETDFVKKTDDFGEFVKDVAMQIAASNPLYIKREDVPECVLDKERDILKEQAKSSGKPEKVIENIVRGRLEKYFEEICLLEQPFVKSPDIKVQDLLNNLIAKIGENINIKRFARFKIGE
ncbi:MAG: translation elongation factor Ts [Thermodesulfobacteriota bacterium]|nr:translation elongation factor Ts [Thermodesulfobacteriota bacterium]